MAYPLGSSDIGVWLYGIDDASSIALMKQYTKIFPQCDANIAAGTHKHHMRHFSYIMRRWLLSHITNIPVERLQFYNTPQGKPVLHDNPVEFSISHSGNYWCMAVAKNTPVGLDIEIMKERKYEAEIVENHFLPSERKAYIEAKSPQERRALFYRCWTAKEALAKMHGISVLEVLSGHIHQKNKNDISFYYSSLEGNSLAMNIACRTPDASVIFFDVNSPSPNGLPYGT